MTQGSVSTDQWSTQLLTDLGDPVTENNVNNLDLWLAQEQNARSWQVDMANPLGVRNQPDGSVGPYPSVAAGVQGTANTLNNGLYASILAALKNNAPTGQFASAVVNSPWSGKTYRERGVDMFLAGGPSSQGPLHVTSAGFWDKLNPVNVLPGVGPAISGVVGGVTGGVEHFIAKVLIVLLGLGLIGAGVYKVASPHKSIDLSSIVKGAAA